MATYPPLPGPRDSFNIEKGSVLAESQKLGKVGSLAGTNSANEGRYGAVKSTRAAFDSAYAPAVLMALFAGHTRDPFLSADHPNGLWVMEVGPEPLINLQMILANSAASGNANDQQLISHIALARQAQVLDVDGATVRQVWTAWYVGQVLFTGGNLTMYGASVPLDGSDPASPLWLRVSGSSQWCDTIEPVTNEDFTAGGMEVFGDKGDCAATLRFPSGGASRLILAGGKNADGQTITGFRPITFGSMG